MSPCFSSLLLELLLLHEWYFWITSWLFIMLSLFHILNHIFTVHDVLGSLATHISLCHLFLVNNCLIGYFIPYVMLVLTNSSGFPDYCPRSNVELLNLSIFSFTLCINLILFIIFFCRSVLPFPTSFSIMPKSSI